MRYFIIVFILAVCIASCVGCATTSAPDFIRNPSASFTVTAE